MHHAILLIAPAEPAIAYAKNLIATEGLSPADYLLFTEDQPIKIAEARQIRRFADLTRFTSPFKLIFLARADQLTLEAANALLKILEEPPAETRFILATDRPERLLPTVRSRCQVMSIPDVAGARLKPTAIPLPPVELAAAFAQTKELAASETPLPSIFESWLQQLADDPATNARTINLILEYLTPAQTTVNRRLLLDNFCLERYNSA